MTKRILAWNSSPLLKIKIEKNLLICTLRTTIYSKDNKAPQWYNIVHFVYKILMVLLLVSFKKLHTIGDSSPHLYAYDLFLISNIRLDYISNTSFAHLCLSFCSLIKCLVLVDVPSSSLVTTKHVTWLWLAFKDNSHVLAT